MSGTSTAGQNPLPIKKVNSESRKQYEYHLELRPFMKSMLVERYDWVRNDPTFLQKSENWENINGLFYDLERSEDLGYDIAFSNTDLLDRYII